MLINFAKTIFGRVWGILAYNDDPVSTGREGTNNKIKTLKRHAYGIRDQGFPKIKIDGIHESKFALVG